MGRLVSRAGLALLASFSISVSFADEADMARGIGDEQLAEIGKRWAVSLSTGDAATLRALLDFEGLGLRGAASLSSNETQRASFVRVLSRIPTQPLPRHRLQRPHATRDHARFKFGYLK